jgi:hypothetical protein
VAAPRGVPEAAARAAIAAVAARMCAGRCCSRCCRSTRVALRAGKYTPHTRERARRRNAVARRFAAPWGQ